MNIFNTFFYQPLLSALIWLCQIVPGSDFGVAVILLTLIIKFLLLPLNFKSIKSQQKISQLDGQLKQIKKKFKNDKEKLGKETLALYQKSGVKPFSGFLLILVQIPILVALYKVFAQGILKDGIETNFLMINLAQPNIFLAGLAGISQFFQSKIQSSKSGANFQKKNSKGSDFSQIMQKQMLYFLPTFTFFVLLRLPSALALYLVTSTIFTILQTFYIQKTSRVEASVEV